MDVSERIKKLMDASELDCEDVVIRIRTWGGEVKYHTVYAWYTGRRNPTAEHIPYVAKALGVTPNDLYGVDTTPAAVA